MVKVDIYTSGTCGYCVMAKELLESKGIKYKELSIDYNPELIAESIKRSGGRRTVPQIFIENHHVGGYDELSQMNKEGKLDSMLGLKYQP